MKEKRRVTERRRGKKVNREKGKEKTESESAGVSQERSPRPSQ